MPPQTTKRRTTKNLKQKKAKLPENQNVWKSNNQGVKEETSIQTGKRGGNGQLARERTYSKTASGGPGQAKQWLRDEGREGGGWQMGRSRIFIRINPEEQLRSETEHTNQGSSMRK